MLKLWYIQINGKREGPYSVKDLKRDTRVTPDTLVWKEGFPNWIPIREVPELKEIFEDEKSISLLDKFKKKKEDITDAEDDVLAIRSDPPNFIIWLFIIFIIVLYFFYIFH